MLEHDMAVDLKTRLNISDNEVDIATKIMRGNVNHIVLDEEIKKKATISIASVLLNKAKEIAKRAKEGRSATPNKVPNTPSPQGTKNITNKAPDAPASNVPATQGTRDVTTNAPDAPKGGAPAPQGTRDITNKTPNGPSGSVPAPQGTRDVATPDNTSSLFRGGKTISPYSGVAVGSIIGGAAGTSLMSRSNADPSKVINNDKKPSETKPTGNGSDSIATTKVTPEKPLGTGGIGSDSVAAPRTNTNMRVVPSRPRNDITPDTTASEPPKPSTGSTAPSTGSVAPTPPPISAPASVASPAPKVIRKGAIVPVKKELSADDLNAISSNLSKNKDAGASGALDEPMAKEKTSAAENIKKRLRQLNQEEYTAKTLEKYKTNKLDDEADTKESEPEYKARKLAPAYKAKELSKEETDFEKMSEKKNKGKYTPLDEPAEKIENKRKQVKFGEPGNEKLSNEELDQEYINGITEASASHTGKIKSSKRIIKTLQKVLERGEPEDFQFENGTTVTLQPAMARMAVGYYNKLSEFEKAQAAKIMRQSFKDFLSIAKRK